MVSQHWLCCYYGLDLAQPAVLDSLSAVYYTVRYLWLGSMDSKINRHGGQLLAVGHNRRDWLGQITDLVISAEPSQPSVVG